ARFVEFVRQNFSHHLAPDAPKVLNPEALTIGFARRFATYKRATLAFSDQERVSRYLTDSDRPIQFVFSGKAHPRDHDGKKLIQEIINFAKRDTIRGKIVFLSDYDISTARRIVQGVDLWLNNPRRPLEACGTSGMKVLANGGLNLSVLDGWWNEAYSQSLGWSIGTENTSADLALQDSQDSDSLYDILENQVIPEFYERTDGVPRKWLEKMKRSICMLVPRFSTKRMLIEYSQEFYFGYEKRD
ncbi:MAG: alpha-glucan family phosphorylase, partial [Nitrososphaerales archaeon]